MTSITSGKTVIATPNLGFDQTEQIPALVPGAVIRAATIAVTAGGKSVNIARVLRAHGRAGTLVGLVGVEDRGRLLPLLTAKRIPMVEVAVSKRTRVNVILVERQPQRMTVINEPGTAIDSAV